MTKRQYITIMIIVTLSLFVLLLTTTQSNAASQLIFRNSSTGEFAYMRLNSNGTLANTTANDGLQSIASDFPGTAFSYVTMKQGTAADGFSTKIIVSNASGARYGWMRLDSNGELANQTVNDGASWVTPDSLDFSNWTYVASHPDADYLVLQNFNNGLLGYIKLNANGTMENYTENSGYGRINYGLDIPSGWRAVSVVEAASQDSESNDQDHIILVNTNTNAGAFIKLNQNGTMVNATLNDGYGLLIPSATTAYTPVYAVRSAASKGLVYKNTSAGTQSYVYVKLNSNGTVENLTQGDGYDFMQTAFDLSGFDVIAEGYIGGADAESGLFLSNAAGGRVAYIKLDNNGLAINATVNDGMAWVNFTDPSGDGWRAVGLDPGTY